MSKEMVARVAKALERELDPLTAKDFAEDNYDAIMAAAARAAIEAMREPTEAMVDAGHSEAPMCEFGIPLTKPCREFNRDAYRAMIDAALL